MSDYNTVLPPGDIKHVSEILPNEFRGMPTSIRGAITRSITTTPLFRMVDEASANVVGYLRSCFNTALHDAASVDEEDVLRRLYHAITGEELR